MLRALFLYLSNQKQLNRFVRSNALAQKAASRFVAGETLDTASAAVKELNARGIKATLDLLGESVTKPDEARAATEDILRIYDRIATDKLDCNVSVKLTQLGLDLSPELVRENVRRLLDRGKSYGIFTRIDMESSAHTQRTLDLFEEMFAVYGRDLVGIVLQSYLYRSMKDAERCVELGARVRLCKGAYKEPGEVAFQPKSEVDTNFAKMMEVLMARGHYAALATHDLALIARAKTFAKAQRITPDRFEFQTLYGIARDVQEQLVRDGYNVRVYVPFGTHWYPYTMRRFAERPANIWFVTRNVLREVGK